MNKIDDSFVLTNRGNKRTRSEIYLLPHYGIPHTDVNRPAENITTHRRRNSIVLRAASEATELVIMALIMFICIRAVAQNYVVLGDSMQPSFESGQFLVVNRLAYKSINGSWLPSFAEFEYSFGKPEVGEVVVFPRDGAIGYDLIKRIVATGGHRIEMIDGVLYLDNQILSETEIVRSGFESWGPILIPDGFLFVLGDNRSNSMDSRIFGLVPETNLVGRVDLRYWPMNSANRIVHNLD
jgi:signal peptidase I